MANPHAERQRDLQTFLVSALFHDFPHTGGMIQRGLADDELLECTPKSLRIRKRILDHEKRMKALKGGKK